METHAEAPDIGLARIPKAFGYAWEGLRSAWRTEAAFRQEAIVTMALVPVACLVGVPVMHRLLLVCSLVFVMLVELLNCAVESAIDRISLERHELSKLAKDAGSAAVLLAIVMAVLVWTVVLSFGAQAAVAPRHAAPIDFSSDEGFHATCTRYGNAAPAKGSTDAERAAYAICATVDLASDVTVWWRDETRTGFFGTAASRVRGRAQLEAYLDRVGIIRRALEPVKARAPLFEVQPGTWAVDIDRDGVVSLQERYLFWVPKRGSPASPLERAASEGELLARYEAPVVNVDQSDVHWALAYCNFVEAALNLVLSYDVDAAGSAIVLVDRERVRARAYPRLREGIRQSMRLRESLLAETDDDREWIANPRQRHTSFPLVMDAQTFATWGTALVQVRELLEGRALFGGAIANGRGMTDLTFGVCPPGTGIDVRDLFLNPLVHAMDRAELASRCVAPSARKPMTGLATLAAGSIERNAASQRMSGEWQVLRHLYWVN